MKSGSNIRPSKFFAVILAALFFAALTGAFLNTGSYNTAASANPRQTPTPSPTATPTPCPSPPDPDEPCPAPTPSPTPSPAMMSGI